MQDNQPVQIMLTRSESAWIANPGIIVRTHRRDLFGVFCQKLGDFHDGTESYVIPKGTRIVMRGFTYEYRDGLFVVIPPGVTSLPVPSPYNKPLPDELELLGTGHA